MLALMDEKTKLYMRVYNHYLEMIKNGSLKVGDKLPSIRACSEHLKLSKTTVENAYLCLAADGYIVSKPQSGYYVTQLGKTGKALDTAAPIGEKEKLPALQYDFSSKAVDKSSFHFDIWRRYIKSALRQDDRLLSYGEVQGELELRVALSEYLMKTRSILCSPKQIVIGAGTQSLLHILCPLLTGKKEVSFPTRSMVQGKTIFENYGYEIHYKDKDAAVIYIPPSHMNRLGDVMPVDRRLELLRIAAGKSMIIEDDYESEFQYQGRVVPAMFGLAQGHGVVYLGTCSRMLLPSIRISYMVLPLELIEQYQQRKEFYNQTASKTEQIALCQFLRDGHMAASIRRLKKIYPVKAKQLADCMRTMIGNRAVIEEHALCSAFVFQDEEGAKQMLAWGEQNGIRFDGMEKGKDGQWRVILSALSLPIEKIEAGVRAVSSFFG